MVLDPVAASMSLDAAKQAFSVLRRRTTKKQFAAYLSAAITELLALHPDIDLAEARILAAEATGEPPSPELLRARQMLKRAKSHAKKGRKPKKAGRRAGGRRKTVSNRPRPSPR